MDPDRWTALKGDLADLLALAPADRPAALASAAPERHDALAAMLADHDAAGTFLDAPAAVVDVGALDLGALATDPLVGQDVGPYRVVRAVGRGGMGEVFLAERADGLFEQRVALKVVHGGSDPALVLRRFADERRILGRLRHAGIARPLDAGTLPDGRPWIAMDFVDGVSITDATAALPLTERVRIVAETARTVHAAHQALVVHRDLKPSNVLVAAGDDGRLHPVLLDFGIAKVLDPETGGVETETGLRPMTRAYAAPEQVRGEPATTATDVHALGILLYEVLTGARPFTGPTPSAVETAILSVDAAPPSRAVAASPAAVPVRELRGDLDTVCLKALAKEPAARYGSAEAFADDLERVLDGRPVAARPPSGAYRARTFVRRHRTGVAVAALALAALVAGVAVDGVRVRAERDRAERAATRAERTAAFLESLFDSSDPNGASPDSLTARDLLDAGAASARADLVGEPVVLARMLTTMGRAYLSLGLYDRAEPALRDAVGLFGASGAGAYDPLGHRDALLELANLEFRTDDYAAAARTAGRALALDSASARPDESERLAILNTLALADLRLGDADGAVRALREVVAGRRGLTSEDDQVDLASNLSNLALILVEQGRADEAGPMLDESLAIVERIRGADHPYVAFGLDARVAVNLQRGDTVQAVADQRRALAIGEAALGADHPFTAHARSGLADLLAGRSGEP